MNNITDFHGVDQIEDDQQIDRRRQGEQPFEPHRVSRLIIDGQFRINIDREICSIWQHLLEDEGDEEELLRCLRSAHDNDNQPIRRLMMMR